jgi:hypothetical protein
MGSLVPLPVVEVVSEIAPGSVEVPLSVAAPTVDCVDVVDESDVGAGSDVEDELVPDEPLVVSADVPELDPGA